eukprot:gene18840-22513_t
MVCHRQSPYAPYLYPMHLQYDRSAAVLAHAYRQQPRMVASLHQGLSPYCPNTGLFAGTGVHSGVPLPVSPMQPCMLHLQDLSTGVYFQQRTEELAAYTRWLIAKHQRQQRIAKRRHQQLQQQEELPISDSSSEMSTAQCVSSPDDPATSRISAPDIAASPRGVLLPATSSELLTMDDDAFWAAVDAVEESPDSEEEEEEEEEEDVFWARADEDVACAAVAFVALPLGGASAVANMTGVHVRSVQSDPRPALGAQPQASILPCLHHLEGEEEVLISDDHADSPPPKPPDISYFTVVEHQIFAHQLIIVQPTM